MEKPHNTPKLKIVLVICLSLTMLLSQASNLHMHPVHDDHAMSPGHGHANTHSIAVHPESTLHDFHLTNHHGDQQINHSDSAIDISSDKLLNKVNFLSYLVLILLFICHLLYIPRRMSATRPTLSNLSFIFNYYLLQPPLRAPPTP